MSDEWQACVAATESFFATRQQAMSPVQSTTVCSDPSMHTSCCSPGAVISDGPCVPVPGFELTTNRTLDASADDNFLSSLPESQCIETYLSDYDNLADAQCLDTTPYALGWFVQQTLPFTTCYSSAFGMYSDEVRLCCFFLLHSVRAPTARSTRIVLPQPRSLVGVTRHAACVFALSRQRIAVF